MRHLPRPDFYLGDQVFSKCEMADLCYIKVCLVKSDFICSSLKSRFLAAINGANEVEYILVQAQEYSLIVGWIGLKNNNSLKY